MENVDCVGNTVREDGESTTRTTSAATTTDKRAARHATARISRMFNKKKNEVLPQFSASVSMCALLRIDEPVLAPSVNETAQYQWKPSKNRMLNLMVRPGTKVVSAACYVVRFDDKFIFSFAIFFSLFSLSTFVRLNKEKHGICVPKARV